MAKLESAYNQKMFERIGLAAAGAVLILVSIDVLFVGRLATDSRASYVFLIRVVLYALAAMTAGAAAARFGWWREHIGRAWTLFALEFVFLLANYIMRRETPAAAAALNATLIAANLAQIAAYWLMARVLASAGIGHLIGGGKRAALTIVALAVAVILCHASLLAQWDALRSGVVQPGSLVSVLADVITFTLVAPLAMSALALRGGQLSWIFIFLTISVLGWMINTGAPSIAALGGGPDALRSIRFAGVALATLFNGAAAAAQSLASARAMKGVPADA